MKIVFTGGGTGGHFYPIIAVAEEIHEIVRERNLLKPKMYFISPTPFDEKVLFENDIEFRQAFSGKMRRYFSLRNFFDMFALGFGTIQATIQLFSIYPDVVFSKGGYASMPTVFAAKLLRIPIFIHESDAIPGRANLWASKFADQIAIAYPETADYFKKKTPVLTGIPIRKEVANATTDGAYEFLGIDRSTPVVFILGGSLGAKKINEVVLSALPDLVTKYQVIHQTGKENFEEVTRTAEVILEQSEYKHRYKPFDFLNALAMKMSAGVASVVVTRAGSSAIAEAAMWGKPSIVIPIPEQVSRDQRKNAYAFARSEAGVVLEEENLTHHLLIHEIDRIVGDEKLQEKMSSAAKAFAKPDAARKIAEELVAIALEHAE